MSNHIILSRYGFPFDLSCATYAWWDEFVFRPEGVLLDRTQASIVLTALRVGVESPGCLWVNFETRAYRQARRRRFDTPIWDGMVAFLRTFFRALGDQGDEVRWEMEFPSRIVWRDPGGHAAFVLATMHGGRGIPTGEDASVRSAPDGAWSNDDYCRFHASLLEPPIDAGLWADTHLLS